MSDIFPAELLSSEKPVAFYGYALPKEGLHDVLLDRMLALGDPSRAEPGNLVYEIHRDLSRPDAIAFYELYENGAAIQKHLNAPYMTAFFADSDSLLESDLEITALELIRSDAPGLD